MHNFYNYFCLELLIKSGRVLAMNKSKLLQIAALSFSLFALPAMAQNVYHVNINNGDDSNDGLKWSTAFKNIQPAIDAATEGDIIYVAAGTYHPTQKVAEFYGENANSATPTTDINRSFLLTRNIKLYGGFPVNASDATTMTDRDWTINQTILSGDFDNNDGPNFENMEENALHVVVMIKPTSEMLIDGFHIIGGGGDESKMVSTIYIGNIPVFQRYGGGIYAFAMDDSSPVLSNLVIRNNWVEKDGGGFFNYSNGGSASPAFVNVTMTNNYAKEIGGAIHNNGKTAANLILRNVNLTGNEALEGGGFACIAEEYSAPEFENILISGNKANKNAGGYILAMGSYAQPTITNATICGNRATVNGGIGGLLVRAGGEARPYIKNSVIWGNKCNNEEYNNLYVRSETQSANPVYTYSFIEGTDLGETNLDGNTDPMFTDPIDADFAPTVSDFGNYKLMPTSPLINKGNNADASLSFDLDGQDRIYGGTIDIGAYEAQTIDPVDNETISIHNPTIWSYQGDLYVKISNNTATVRACSINGTLTKQINNLGEGTHALKLPEGLYIVTLSTGETAKICIR